MNCCTEQDFGATDARRQGKKLNILEDSHPCVSIALIDVPFKYLLTH